MLFLWKYRIKVYSEIFKSNESGWPETYHFFAFLVGKTFLLLVDVLIPLFMLKFNIQ